MQARNHMEEQAVPIRNGRKVQQLVEAYAPMLKGIRDPYKLQCQAILLDNQMRHAQHVMEDVTSSAAAQYTKSLFAIQRRVWLNLIAFDLFSVQPMNAPVGAIFYHNYKYGVSKGSVTQGSVVIENFNEYFSSEYVDQELLATGDGSKYGGVSADKLKASLAWKPVRSKDTDAGIQVVLTDGTQELKDDGAGNLTGDGTGRINYTTGQIWDVVFTAAPSNGAKIYASYYYNSELNDQQPEIIMETVIDPIKVGGRKLRATWSAEAADDLAALQGIDAEADLVAGISNMTQLEIDRELIWEVKSRAQFSDTYDFTPAAGLDDIKAIRGILTTIGNMSAQIHKSTLLGGASWIVTSPKIANYLEQLTTHGDYLPAFANNMQQPYSGGVNPTAVPNTWGPETSHAGIYQWGTLARKYRVYVDPLMPDDEILLGLKGQGQFDVGYIYSPYVPLELTQTFNDPRDQSRVKGLRTRYAKKMVRTNYYGVIKVSFPS